MPLLRVKLPARGVPGGSAHLAPPPREVEEEPGGGHHRRQEDVARADDDDERNEDRPQNDCQTDRLEPVAPHRPEETDILRFRNLARVPGAVAPLAAPALAV